MKPRFITLMVLSSAMLTYGAFATAVTRPVTEELGGAARVAAVTLVGANSPAAKPSGAEDENITHLFDFSDQRLPGDMRRILIKYAAKAKYEGENGRYGNPLHLALVCRGWNTIISADKNEVGTPCWKWLHGVMTPQDEQELKIFLNGRLICKPNPESDEGIVELRISDLAQPLSGAFNLSQCSDVVKKYLYIGTGLRIGVTDAHEGMAEIFIIPWFLAHKQSQTPAGSYLLPIMDGWDRQVAPYGIFYHWWEHGNQHYGYSIWAWPGDPSKNTLWDVYTKNCVLPAVWIDAGCPGWEHHSAFSCFVCELK